MFNRIRVVTMLMMVLGSRISKVLLFLTIFDSSKVNLPQHGI